MGQLSRDATWQSRQLCVMADKWVAAPATPQQLTYAAGGTSIQVVSGRRVKKHYPPHTHPLISICEFLKLYELLTHPTPPLHELHDPLHLYMTHTTPHLHDPPHPCMTHPTPVWPSPPLHDPPNPCMIHPPLHDPPQPYWGALLVDLQPHSLSWFKKLSLTHTHPLISISEILEPYDWLFLEFESSVKGWM